MDICDYTLFSGWTVITDGYKNIGVTDFEYNPYQLPSSVRIFRQGDGDTDFMLNNGLVWLSGRYVNNNNSLPNTVRVLNKGTYNEPPSNLNHLNNGLIYIGYRQFYDYQKTGYQVPSSFPDSLMYVGTEAFRYSSIGGDINLKAPFIGASAFKDCSGITSFNLDITDKQYDGSYIGEGALGIYEHKPYPPDNWPLPKDITLNSVTIKGYEKIINPFLYGNEATYVKKLQIIGNGKTEVVNGDFYVSDSIEFGDGVVSLGYFFISGWNMQTSWVSQDVWTKTKTVTLGKDITSMWYSTGWTPSDDYLISAEKVYIEKSDDIFLKSYPNVAIKQLFGDVDAIYVPSSIYNEYTTYGGSWTQFLSKISPY